MLRFWRKIHEVLSTRSAAFEMTSEQVQHRENEPFARRWSRRKINHSQSVERACTAASLPALGEANFADVDFDTLDFNSDYARFMAQGVPDAIRARALRSLWASNAEFVKPDGLQDYTGDFTDAALAAPTGGLQTAYTIGRGFMIDDEIVAWARLGERVDDEVG